MSYLLGVVLVLVLWLGSSVVRLALLVEISGGSFLTCHVHRSLASQLQHLLDHLVPYFAVPGALVVLEVEPSAAASGTNLPAPEPEEPEVEVDYRTPPLRFLWGCSSSCRLAQHAG